MLKIRLRRTGAKKQPRYRVVVAESTAPRDGAYVEVLGWYNPQADPAQVHVDTEKAQAWIQKGARPSDRVAYLLKQANAPQAEPEPAAEPEKPARKPRASKAKAEVAAPVEPPASEALESQGSAATVETATTEAVQTDEPESEGSAGATPA